MSNYSRNISSSLDLMELSKHLNKYEFRGLEYLKQISFITRVPGTFELEGAITDQALGLSDGWCKINDDYRYQSFSFNYLGFDQRWVVIWSKGAFNRAVSSLERKRDREKESIDKKLKSLQKQGFESEEDALNAFQKIEGKWKLQAHRGLVWKDGFQPA